MLPNADGTGVVVVLPNADSVDVWFMFRWSKGGNWPDGLVNLRRQVVLQ